MVKEKNWLYKGNRMRGNNFYLSVAKQNLSFPRVSRYKASYVSNIGSSWAVRCCFRLTQFSTEDLRWILPIYFWGRVTEAEWAVLSMTRLEWTFWDAQLFYHIANPPAWRGWEIQGRKLPVTQLLWVTVAIIWLLALHLHSGRGAWRSNGPVKMKFKHKDF